MKNNNNEFLCKDIFVYKDIYFFLFTSKIRYYSEKKK